MGSRHSVHSAHSAELGMARTKAMGGFRLTEFAQPPHRRLPWHEHHDASVCFVVSGSYAERTAREHRECPPQSVVFKPAAERHADQFGRDGGTCLLIEIGAARLETIEPFSDITARPGLVRSAALAGLGHRIYREFGRGDGLSALAVEGLVLELLVEASRGGAADPAPARPTWLRRAHELIHAHAAEPLTLSSIARDVGVHPAHLARTFRAHFRRSVGDYVRGLRIERAARELAEGSAPIADIALRSGFFDQSHFSRVFREHTGLTPAAFRAAARPDARPHARTRPQRPS
jgi:AraC family transcriptional regulator